MIETYVEPIESKNLIYLNQQYLDLTFSSQVQAGGKIDILKTILYWKNIKQLRRQATSKFFHNKYYNQDGNYLYTNYLHESEITLPRDSKLVVYTCIVGEYDTFRFPLFYNEDVDYYVFTDQDIESDGKMKVVDIRTFDEYGQLSPTAMNRKIKMLPQQYLKEYDCSLYVDGNIQVVADVYPMLCNMAGAVLGIHTHAARDCAYMEGDAVKLVHKGDPQKINAQLARYRAEGFPEHFGLFQNSILIRNHADPLCIRLMEDWWEEYCVDETRDQLSLPYVMWKNQVTPNRIKIMSRNAGKNPRFFIHKHA